MKPTHLMMAGVFALALTVFAPQSAKAQYGFGGPRLYNQSPYWGHAYGASLYSLARIPVPPYYSLHPPVYYGRRVRASYGVSPFPQGPNYGTATQSWRASGVLSLPISKPTPKVVVNPYFQGEVQPVKSESAPVATQVIVNPYYQRDDVKRLS